MSNGDPPPAGCPECAKVILNGGIAARVLDETCYTIKEHLEAGHSFKNIKNLVIQANKVEDEAFKFTRMVLDGLDFKGPYSHAVDVKV